MTLEKISKEKKEYLMAAQNSEGMVKEKNIQRMQTKEFVRFLNRKQIDMEEIAKQKMATDRVEIETPLMNQFYLKNQIDAYCSNDQSLDNSCFSPRPMTVEM